MALRLMVVCGCISTVVFTPSLSGKLQAPPPLSLYSQTPQSITYRSSIAFRKKHSRGNGGVRCCSAPDTFDQNEVLKDAAKGGNLRVVNELLQGKLVNIDLPSTNRAGWTALHLASFYGHDEIVKSLLKAGADIEVRNDSGNTPLQLACLKGNIQIAKTLLTSGADIHAESSDKGTALDYAQEWGGDEIVDFLLLWAARNS